MLSLDSPRWSDLRHAYGAADDIPELLRQLSELPGSRDREEPWFSLWSSLAHQGDVYGASFAAIPHVVNALATAPEKADAAYFQFPAWIEICRKKNDVDIPSDLQNGYFAALSQLPTLAAVAAKTNWSPDLLSCVLAAIAVAKGQTEMAEAALELTPEVAREFMEWHFQR